ncbi:hypothetical protein [Microvirga massiliensis]|uniref:hypothetical protein n=1 Tax=Microvirga massiliensis TaxID=1033741 RepID=UPI00062B351B|nr:hypothetical protein [Microvirga massiliensis]
MAADAYEATVAAVGGPLSEPSREHLAHFILERLFHGERDAERLQVDALVFTKRVFGGRA